MSPDTQNSSSQAAASVPAGLTGEATAPAAAAAPSWINAEGRFAANWTERLGGELKGNPALTVMPGIADLAKSYVATKAMVGRKFSPPGEGATREEVSQWRRAVGAPERPEDYGSLRPETIAEEAWDSAAEKTFLQIAHKYHLPPAAVKEIAGVHAQSVSGAMEQIEASEAHQMEVEASKLRQAWGSEFDQNLGLARRFAATLGLEAENPAFRSAEVVMAMAKGAALINVPVTFDCGYGQVTIPAGKDLEMGPVSSGQTFTLALFKTIGAAATGTLTVIAQK